MASEASMMPSHQGPSHSYRDLRSERRARNRERKNRKKYGNFRTTVWNPALQPIDLPSSPSQQAHYAPVCHDHCANPLNPDCWMRTFPADLSTAPIVKFTKREAYNEAKWTRPTSCKRSVTHWKEWPKWQARTQSKKAIRREIRTGDWHEDARDSCEDMGNDPSCFEGQWSPLDDDIWWICTGVYRLVGSNSDDYRDTKDLVMRSTDGNQYFRRHALWHRHPLHGWFRMPAECEDGVCACVPMWDEPIYYEELDKETFYLYADGGDLDAHGAVDEGYISEEYEEQSEVDDEWDVVSNAPSTTWSEIDYP